MLKRLREVYSSKVRVKLRALCDKRFRRSPFLVFRHIPASLCTIYVHICISRARYAYRIDRRYWKLRAPLEYTEKNEDTTLPNKILTIRPDTIAHRYFRRSRHLFPYEAHFRSTKDT